MFEADIPEKDRGRGFRPSYQIQSHAFEKCFPSQPGRPSLVFDGAVTYAHAKVLWLVRKARKLWRALGALGLETGQLAMVAKRTSYDP